MKKAARRKAVPKRKPAARRKAAPKRAAKRKAAPKRKPAPRRASRASRWQAFVAKHGIVLASARGAVPSIAEAVAGEPIVGSWWAHPRGKAIFAALSELDDSVDIRCFKLLDGKVTFVHRRLWPALVRLAQDGVYSAAQVASLQQEHMPTGEHRNIVTAFPDWVDEETARAAEKLTPDKARTLLRLA